VRRTSESHPITVDFVPAESLGLPGRLGLTFAPGKKADAVYDLAGDTWDRDLEQDLARLRSIYAADVLVCLLEPHELEYLEIPLLFERAAAHGLEPISFPIQDVGVPASLEATAAIVDRILGALRAGRTVVLHCRGGVGRTGLIGACCLVALGHRATEAIAVVRRARNNPRMVETRPQEEFVARFERLRAACDRSSGS
jgi:protein-tyrosine phosphatase